MAKTVFSNGDVVMPAFINSVYGPNASGGHRHDGGDDDGHVGKILLTDASDVSGQLPLANQASHNHNGTDRSKINLAAAAEVVGQLPFANLAEFDQHVRTTDGPTFDHLHIQGAEISGQFVTYPGYCDQYVATPVGGAIAAGGSRDIVSVNLTNFSMMVDALLTLETGGEVYKIVGACYSLARSTTIYYSVEGGDLASFSVSASGVPYISIVSGQLRLSNNTLDTIRYFVTVRSVRRAGF